MPLFLCDVYSTICHLLNTLSSDLWMLSHACQWHKGLLSFAFLPCSRIVDKMHDSGSGIRPSPNMEQGSTYKKTFIGEPPLLGAGPGCGNLGHGDLGLSHA